MDRDLNLKRVAERSEPWDIVVIGGGATGAGCALDAASRGLSVLLLEQHDFGKGTSSRSTKLIHGGVRYLRQGNIALVREALRERGILLRNAPHVVRRQAFVIPCYARWEKAFYGLGLKVYDLLAGKNSIRKTRVLSREEVLEQLPNVKEEGLRGGILYFDTQFDDTRLLIDILRTADQHGAVVLNYARVERFESNAGGQITGLGFVDLETGVIFNVKARAVINATGVFSDQVRRSANADSKPALTFSQGVHVVLERKFLPGDAAILVPRTPDGRVLFCIPWHDHVILGTTETPIEAPALEPQALDAEIDLILGTAGEYLATRPKREDILSVWAGIRPLVRRDNVQNTARLSRGYDLFVDSGGLITITGGKWTTYRRMAEDTVNKAIEAGGIQQRECVTGNLLILPPERIEDTRTLNEAGDVSRGDVVRAVRFEMARTVEDILARRTRALLLDANAAVEVAAAVAQIMSDELGRDEEWIELQLASFAQVAASYRDVLRSDS